MSAALSGGVLPWGRLGGISVGVSQSELVGMSVRFFTVCSYIPKALRLSDLSHDHARTYTGGRGVSEVVR